MTMNPFGEEFDAPEPKSKITHDNWGRYNNLPPVPGFERKKTWTRVTTIKGTLPDKYNLSQWDIRQVVLGLAAKPELLEQVTERVMEDPDSNTNKGILQAIGNMAKEIAGTHKGADEGTHYHAILENHSRDIPQNLSRRDQMFLDACLEALDRRGLEIVPELTERVVVIPGIGAAGKFDNAFRDRNTGALYVGDLKTQKWEPGEYDGMDLAIQLSSYAHAEYMLDEESWGWVPAPKFDRKHGAVIWSPAKQPKRVDVKRVDLQNGKMATIGSVKVREWRSASKKWVTDW